MLAYVRRTFAGALPTELKVHVDTLKTEQSNVSMICKRLHFLEPFLGQALGLLVPVSSIHYCTSTSGLSTSSSTTCLTPQGMRDLILGKVSRLDAFSVYLVRT